MNTIKLTDFVNRVLISNERVQFTYVDPYNHLNANRYLEFILNHRVSAAENQIQCSTTDILKTLRIGFVISNVTLKYLKPALLGEELEIASWVSQVRPYGFKISALISGCADKTLRLNATLEFNSIKLSDGSLVEMPSALPTRSPDNLILLCPTTDDYLGKLALTSKDIL